MAYRLAHPNLEVTECWPTMRLGTDPRLRDCATHRRLGVVVISARVARRPLVRFVIFSPKALCAHYSAIDPFFAAFPTYSISHFPKDSALHSSNLTLHSLGDDQDVVNAALCGTNSVRGPPNFDPKRVVHASQTIEALKRSHSSAGPVGDSKNPRGYPREHCVTPFPFLCPSPLRYKSKH